MSEEIRLLGARDGLVTGLLAVRAEIDGITRYRPINSRHTRKIEERRRILEPLYRVAALLEKQRNDVMKALDDTRKKP